VRRDCLQDNLRHIGRGLHHEQLLRGTELRFEEGARVYVYGRRTMHDGHLRRPLLLDSLHVPAT
jgi:hypothetical protein